MLDSQPESIYYPKTRIAPEAVRHLLCVAPHPDDEILGCGGLLALVARHGGQVATMILTQGEAQAAEASSASTVSSGRKQESEAAARLLALPVPEWGHFQDRQLRYGEPLIAAISERMAAMDRARDSHESACLLLPSLSEPHPDHQAVALAGVAAVQRQTAAWTVLFYEVGAPFVPNAVLDITPVAAEKWAALGAFVSQESVQPYRQHAQAMASLRAFGLGPAVGAAEAYFRVSADDLRRQGPGAAMPGWPQRRSALQLATSSTQLPLVSVLIRSVDRSQLLQALASVAAQTYPHLQVVVVNASGRPHSPVVSPAAHVQLQLVDPWAGDLRAPSGAEFLTRPQAANTALAAAQGELAVFLDDDDLFYPGHIERLVGSLLTHPGAMAAYSGVRVEDAQGNFVRQYDIAWSRERLAGINFLPIHAVLFRLGRVQASQLRFDERLPVLEDWHFWNQLADQGEFVHAPGVGAVYRQGLGHSGIGDALHPHHWATWHTRILGERLAQTDAADQVRLLARHALLLDGVQTNLDTTTAALQAAQTQNRVLGQQLTDEQQRGQHAQHEAQQALQAQAERYDAAVANLLKEHGQQQVQLLQQAQAAQDAQTTSHADALAHAQQAAQQALDAQQQAHQHALHAAADQLQATAQQLQSEWRGHLDAQAQQHLDEVAALQNRIAQLQQSLAQAMAHESTLTHELNGLYRSRSWRMTQPLRSAMARLRPPAA